MPVPGLQVPARWHWSDAVQTTGFMPVHEPFTQVSVWVQALPSEHEVPFGFACGTHWSVASLQTPRLHWSPALEQSRAVPAHVPPEQASFTVQNWPSLQGAVLFGCVHVPAPLQTSFVHTSPALAQAA